jgi:hypothetical protein
VIKYECLIRVAKCNENLQKQVCFPVLKPLVYYLFMRNVRNAATGTVCRMEECILC